LDPNYVERAIGAAERHPISPDRTVVLGQFHCNSVRRKRLRSEANRCMRRSPNVQEHGDGENNQDIGRQERRRQGANHAT
jgi:hypothetical protein